MENKEYVSCKKCQCEITNIVAEKYNGYCKNCYEENHIGISKKQICLGIIIILIVTFTILFISWKDYHNTEIAENEFIEKIEEQMKDVYKNDRAIEYGLTDVQYEIRDISKVKDTYEISLNLKCKANENLSETEKSLLAYAVEDYVPDGFNASNGYEITVRNSKNGFYQMINTSINGEVVHNERENSENINNSRITEEEKGYAIAVAKEEVKNNLKSPSSADFPSSFDEYTITKDGDTYTVNSYVEADNSFGTKLKINYIVQFTMTGKETYIVNNVIVDE